jgi:hypothetical protein
MLRCIYIAGLAAAFLVGISTFASAQGRGGMSGLGGTGFGGGMGMGGMGMSGMGMGGMGMGGMGTSSFGRSAFGGMSGMGGSGFGGMGMGNSAFGGSGFGGSAFGRSGMGGGMYGGQGGGQAFVGRDSGDMSAVFNQMGRAGTQFFNQMNRNMRAGGQNRNNRNRQTAGTQENAASAVRVQLNLGFTPPRPASNVVTNTIRTRLANILPAQGAATPDVTMDGDVAVLRGVAASENQRRVLETLISLEPGVMGVRNEMTIASSTSDEQ